MLHNNVVVVNVTVLPFVVVLLLALLSPLRPTTTTSRTTAEAFVSHPAYNNFRRSFQTTTTTTTTYNHRRSFGVPLSSSFTTSTSSPAILSLRTTKPTTTATRLFLSNYARGKRQTSNNHLQSKQEMIQFMEQPQQFSTTTTTTALDDNDTLSLVQCIVEAADGRKAEQIVAWIVHPITTLTSVVIVVSGNSRPQNQAIASAIQKAVRAQAQEQEQVNDDNNDDTSSTTNNRPNGPLIEGTAESGWMILDYGNVMVHIMTPKSRLFYNIEGQWKDKAACMDLSDILIPNSTMQQQSSSFNDNEFNNKPTAVQRMEDDPFWS